MPKIVLRIIPALLFWGMFAIAVFELQYPESLTQANKYQVFLFFIPLFLAISVSVNLLLKNFLSAGSVSLGLIFLLVLKTLDSLNLLTAVLTILATALFVSYFRKTKRSPSIRQPRTVLVQGRPADSGFKNLTPIQSGLTKLPKVPKLTKWRKHTSLS